jgi:ornithine cyclodeaminase/alanine dehydrogenase-like protein (mu-crystallin family)
MAGADHRAGGSAGLLLVFPALLMILLSDADVRDVLNATDLVATMELALVAYSTGRAAQPQRVTLHFGPEYNWLGIMPASLDGVLGAKLVAVVPANEARGFATHPATIVLLDAQSGRLAALLDATSLTTLRTAAVSAVSVKYMARPDSQRLAILGSGAQARAHLAAFSALRQWSDVRAWSPTQEHLDRFADETGVTAASSARECVGGADVILLATSSGFPVVDGDWVSPGSHIISIGAYQSSMREMDPALLARARLIVDSRAGALTESGDVVQGIREGWFNEPHIAGELGEVVAGLTQGRTSADQITVFKSLGMAVEDLAAAGLALSRAKELGKGTEIAL